jgi:hypothetical protein
VFQVAIANALGEWIIPPTVISHQSSASELNRKAWKAFRARTNSESLQQSPAEWRMWEGLVMKFHEEVDGDITTRRTWEEIAGQLRAYTKV